MGERIDHRNTTTSRGLNHVSLIFELSLPIEIVVTHTHIERNNVNRSSHRIKMFSCTDTTFYFVYATKKPNILSLCEATISVSLPLSICITNMSFSLYHSFFTSSQFVLPSLPYFCLSSSPAYLSAMIWLKTPLTFTFKIPVLIMGYRAQWNITADFLPNSIIIVQWQTDEWKKTLWRAQCDRIGRFLKL